MYQWCGFKSRRGKNKNLTALKSNSNTVWFNFQTYIYIYIYIYTDLYDQLRNAPTNLYMYIPDAHIDTPYLNNEKVNRVESQTVG